MTHNFYHRTRGFVVLAPGDSSTTRYVGVDDERDGAIVEKDTKWKKNIGMVQLELNAELVKHRLQDRKLVVGLFGADDTYLQCHFAGGTVPFRTF
jgi:hypothetical protein